MHREEALTGTGRIMARVGRNILKDLVGYILIGVEWRLVCMEEGESKSEGFEWIIDVVGGRLWSAVWSGTQSEAQFQG